ncbi:MAG TPA: hypothetical protein VJ867_06735, partial [Gemmatimonadaceae bacterium]|nr:hypothetical protein [Gemmatimonadaceae bacterium]
DDDVLIPSSIATPEYDGSYTLDATASFRRLRDEIAKEVNPRRAALGQTLLDRMVAMNDNLHIAHGVLRAGSPTVRAYPIVQEFSIKSLRPQGDAMYATAAHHEDIHDPGDVAEVQFALRKDDVGLQLIFWNDGGKNDTLFYVRRP